MKSKHQSPKYGIPKEDFIEFLASATPEEINNYIQEKGKPRKVFYPLIYHPKKSKEETNNEYSKGSY